MSHTGSIRFSPRTHQLSDGRTILIREAEPDDARAVLEHVEATSGESDFLTFGPGEFEMTEAAEREFLRGSRDADHQLYLLGLVDGALIATLSFAAGRRRRVRHSGEFGMSVRRSHWGRGVGSHLLDALVGWADATRVIRKINLRVRTDNRRAVALYERKGFAIEGTIHGDICVDDAYFDLHWMGRQVGAGPASPSFADGCR